MPINPAGQDAQSFTAINLGFRVDDAAAALVQNDSVNLFTVSGGLVLVRALIGEVTTVIGANAISVNYRFTKTGGSAVAISGPTVVTSDAVGTLYGITGVAVDLLSAQKVGGTEIPLTTYLNLFPSSQGIVLPAGTLSILSTNADPDGGALKHSLWYIPLDDGASVAAA